MIVMWCPDAVFPEMTTCRCDVDVLLWPIQTASFFIAALCLLFSILVVYYSRRGVRFGYHHGMWDGLRNDTSVKVCGDVDPSNLLPSLLKLNSTAILPSRHCICSWKTGVDASSGDCRGWSASAFARVAMPFVVSKRCRLTDSK
jgi:hypothetical protein